MCNLPMAFYLYSYFISIQIVKLWDLRIMRSPVCTINLNSGANRICSITTTNSDSSTETFLGIPLDNRDIKIYNLNGERMLRLPRSNRVGHRRLVTSMASHGNLLLSASFDKTINCWSLDYNPPKSSSNKTTVASSSVNNNKENSVFTEQHSNGHNFDQLNKNGNNNGDLARNLLLHGIASPPPSTQLTSSSQQQQLNQAQSAPLTLITNNSTALPTSTSANNSATSKTMHTLTKLTERIKI